MTTTDEATTKLVYKLTDEERQDLYESLDLIWSSVPEEKQEGKQKLNVFFQKLSKPKQDTFLQALKKLEELQYEARPNN